MAGGSSQEGDDHTPSIEDNPFLCHPPVYPHLADKEQGRHHRLKMGCSYLLPRWRGRSGEGGGGSVSDILNLFGESRGQLSGQGTAD